MASSWLKSSDRLPVCSLTRSGWVHGMMDLDGRVSDIKVKVPHWQPSPELPKEYAKN